MVVDQKKPYDVTRDNTFVASSADSGSYIREYFIPRNLDHIELDRFLNPQIVTELANRALKQKLLIIASQPDIQADHLLPYIAWELREILQRREESEQNFRFLECDNQRDLTKFELVTELAHMNSVIIIVPSVSPQYLEWNLANLQKNLSAAQSFTICSTNIPRETWHLDTNDNQFWFDLPEALLYSPEFLAEYLTEQLIQHQKSLPKNLREIIEPDQKLFSEPKSSLTLRDIAKKLRTDTNISIFVRNICSLTNITEKEIQDLILSSQQCRSEIIKKWFFNLSRKEQLLALGVSFFDGLAEEQVFSALQILTSTIWQQSGTLGIFDYLDLKEVFRFFPITHSSTNTRHTKLQGILPNQRQAIIKLGWNEYRVHISRALPWLVQTVKDSMKQGASLQDLYGDERQREQLRNVITATVSDIGAISLDLIQDALLWLVADNVYQVQVVAARILANLYRCGKEEQFFSILWNWQSDKRSLVFLEKALEQQYEKGKYDTQQCVDSAIILAVSYVAKFLPSNNIPIEIITILNNMIEDPSERIIIAINTYTIPMLISTHLEQMSEIIEQMLLNTVFHQALSDSFVRVYKKKDISILYNFDKMLKKHTNIPNSNISSSNEEVFAVITRTLIKLWYIETTTNSKGLEIRKQLQTIFSHKNTPLVREAFLEEVIRNHNQDEGHFPSMEKFFCNVLYSIEENEIEEISQIFFNQYIKERKDLKGGDAIYIHNKQAYEVWLDIDHQRPSLPIERRLYTWLVNVKDYPKQLQLIAIRTSLIIIDQFEEKERIFCIKELRRRNQERDEYYKYIQYDHSTKTTISQDIVSSINKCLDRLMCWLSTIMLTNYRISIRRILLKVNYYYNIDPKSIRLLLDKWDRVLDFRPIPIYSGDMRIALGWMRKRKLVFIFLSIVLVFILAILYIL
ncbi:MAG: hypothetical protein AAGF95_07090 [Chloroflexota bacterium]